MFSVEIQVTPKAKDEVSYNNNNTILDVKNVIFKGTKNIYSVGRTENPLSFMKVTGDRRCAPKEIHWRQTS